MLTSEMHVILKSFIHEEDNELAKSVRGVLDSPEMKKRAEELGAVMQKEDGVKRAVELIENRFAAASRSF